MIECIPTKFDVTYTNQDEDAIAIVLTVVEADVSNTLGLTPAAARELAAELVRAADDAEGV